MNAPQRSISVPVQTGVASAFMLGAPTVDIRAQVSVRGL
jgi:hypothetical protein